VDYVEAKKMFNQDLLPYMTDKKEKYACRIGLKMAVMTLLTSKPTCNVQSMCLTQYAFIS